MVLINNLSILNDLKARFLCKFDQAVKKWYNKYVLGNVLYKKILLGVNLMAVQSDIGIIRIPDYDKFGNRTGETVFVRHPVFTGDLTNLNDVYFRSELLEMASPSDFKNWSSFLRENADDLDDILPDIILVWNLNVSQVIPKIRSNATYAIIF